MKLHIYTNYIKRNMETMLSLEREMERLVFAIADRLIKIASLSVTVGTVNSTAGGI